MKSLTLLLASFFIFSITAYSQDFKKLSAAETDKGKVKIAQDFASDFLTKLKAGEEYLFQDKATDVVKNQFTFETQKLINQQLKSQFGDFKSLEYAESWIQNGTQSINIFRFKGEFDKSPAKMEIRVVLNEFNKIAGLWIKPWAETL
jgi:hypothetical protein